MMGTEVLRPHDCLIERFQPHTASFHRRRNYGHHRKVARPDRQDAKRQHQLPTTASRRSASPEEARSSPKSINNNGVVFGKVTILRRGESLDGLNARIKRDLTKSTPFKANLGGGADMVLFGTERLGPEQPAMVPMQIRIGKASEKADVYAGSAVFSMSPSPRALPLPSFCKPSDDSATRDLRRLLRLE